jgi:hypothetical protein
MVGLKFEHLKWAYQLKITCYLFLLYESSNFVFNLP